jgi:hypothetical protein
MRFTAVVALAWVLGACSGARPGSGTAPQGFDGAECKKPRLVDGASRESDVLARTCASGEPRFASDAQASVSVQRRHRMFDDRHPDLVSAALTTIDSAQFCEHDRLATGISAYYAELVEPSALAAQLASVSIGEGAKEAFVQRAMAAKQQLAQRVSALDPHHKRLYVDVPREVASARRAYYDKNAALYAKLDDLEKKADEARAAKAAPSDLVKAFHASRSEYLAACAEGASCRFDPFVVEVGRQLVQLHAAAGEPLLAKAEDALLAEPAAGRHLFAVETGTAIYRSMLEEKKSFDDWTAAKKAGADDAALATKFGSPPPIEVVPSTDYVGAELLPSLSAGDDPFEFAAGFVRSVTDLKKTNGRGEALAQVTFADNVLQADVLDCHETGKVVGATFDASRHARLQYESVCVPAGTKTKNETMAPVIVPLSEATLLKPGEELIAVVAPATREGVVVRVLARHVGAGTGVMPVLQLRTHRFAAKK